jgi:CheY-like chemotaxis protein
MTTKRILILEDDLETISAITKALTQYENENIGNFDIAVTVLSEYIQVEEYINKLDKDYFDLILIDRYYKGGDSFHVLDFDKFGVDNIISISFMAKWDEEAKKKGIKTIVKKNYNLNKFAKQLIEEIKKY